MTATRPGPPGADSSAVQRAADDPQSLDDRVVDTVVHCLAEYLAARRGAVRESDACVADEVVARLERFTLGGGRRMRPLFAWWGWRAAGGAPSGPMAHGALQAASALELIQACALVQDDVMDGSATRRGQPAMHTALAEEHRAAGWKGDPGRYGRSVAVLAGDLALVWADDLLDEVLVDFGGRGRVRDPWHAMRTEMIAGQFLDIRTQAAADESEAAALRVDRLKTAAYSVERPLHFGAALAGADSELVSTLRAYGADIGTAFQLRDDLLGMYGDPARTGKPVGDDLREGKRTLLLSIGLKQARQRGDRAAEDTLRAAAGDAGLTADDIEAVAGLLDDLGARDAVEEYLHRLVERGLRQVADSAIAGDTRARLAELARWATAHVR